MAMFQNNTPADVPAVPAAVATPEAPPPSRPLPPPPAVNPRAAAAAAADARHRAAREELMACIDVAASVGEHPKDAALSAHSLSAGEPPRDEKCDDENAVCKCCEFSCPADLLVGGMCFSCSPPECSWCGDTRVWSTENVRRIVWVDRDGESAWWCDSCLHETRSS